MRSKHTLSSVRRFELLQAVHPVQAPPNQHGPLLRIEVVINERLGQSIAPLIKQVTGMQVVQLEMKYLGISQPSPHFPSRLTVHLT